MSIKIQKFINPFEQNNLTGTYKTVAALNYF
jgi:hypothetical protein